MAFGSISFDKGTTFKLEPVFQVASGLTEPVTVDIVPRNSIALEKISYKTDIYGEAVSAQIDDAYRISGPISDVNTGLDDIFINGGFSGKRIFDLTVTDGNDTQQDAVEYEISGTKPTSATDGQTINPPRITSIPTINLNNVSQGDIVDLPIRTELDTSTPVGDVGFWVYDFEGTSTFQVSTPFEQARYGKLVFDGFTKDETDSSETKPSDLETAYGLNPEIKSLLETFRLKIDDFSNSFKVLVNISNAGGETTKEIAFLDGLVIGNGTFSTSTKETFTEQLPDPTITTLESSVTATLTLSDPNAATITTSTSNNVTSTFSNGVWQASGSISDVEEVLADAEMQVAAGFVDDFTIEFKVEDGASAPVTFTWDITEISQPPNVIVDPGTLKIFESQTKNLNSVLDTLTFDDPDSHNLWSLNVSIDPSKGSLSGGTNATYDSSTGVLTTPPLDKTTARNELDSLSITVNAGETQPGNIGIGVDDQIFGPTVKSLILDEQSVPPTITLSPSVAKYAFDITYGFNFYENATFTDPNETAPNHTYTLTLSFNDKATVSGTTDKGTFDQNNNEYSFTSNDLSEIENEAVFWSNNLDIINANSDQFTAELVLDNSVLTTTKTADFVRRIPLTSKTGEFIGSIFQTDFVRENNFIFQQVVPMMHDESKDFGFFNTVMKQPTSDGTEEWPIIYKFNPDNKSIEEFELSRFAVNTSSTFPSFQTVHDKFTGQNYLLNPAISAAATFNEDIIVNASRNEFLNHDPIQLFTMSSEDIAYDIGNDFLIHTNDISKLNSNGDAFNEYKIDGSSITLITGGHLLDGVVAENDIAFVQSSNNNRLYSIDLANQTVINDISFVSQPGFFKNQVFGDKLVSVDTLSGGNFGISLYDKDLNEVLFKSISQVDSGSDQFQITSTTDVYVDEIEKLVYLIDSRGYVAIYNIDTETTNDFIFIYENKEFSPFDDEFNETMFRFQKIAKQSYIVIKGTGVIAQETTSDKLQINTIRTEP